jgi:hypothetical protein
MKLILFCPVWYGVVKTTKGLIVLTQTDCVQTAMDLPLITSEIFLIYT